MRPSNPLEQWFQCHTTGPGIWRWHHYWEIYHRHLEKFRGREVHIAEVGVYSGGSLEMWRDYFGPKATIHGIDIQEACRRYAGGQIRIHIGDQADRTFWKRFKEEVPQLDVLIDDGGHDPNQQIVTVEEILPHLNYGGVYICEDIHGENHGFVGYLNWIVGRLNEIVMATDTTLHGWRATPFQRDVHSLHVYPYIAVLERNQTMVDTFTSPVAGTEWIWKDPEWKP